MTGKERKTDEELTVLARNGEKWATDELLHRYSGLVRSCARGFFMVGGETEDIWQEGMVGLFDAIVNYQADREGGSSFKTFARTCISRNIVDSVKKAARKKNMPLNQYVSVVDSEWAFVGTDPEEALIVSDESREFRQKMSKVLSDFEFKVMVMYMDGLSCGEICEACGKSAKSVDNAIQRSKRKLQEILKR